MVMHKSVSLDLFKKISIRNYNLMISHLQYVDDTLIFCESVLEQLLNVKRVLCCFQIMSGLKIDFQKSKLSGIGIEHQTLVSWADRISCLIESFPSKYLGLPLSVSSSSHTT